MSIDSQGIWDEPDVLLARESDEAALLVKVELFQIWSWAGNANPGISWTVKPPHSSRALWGSALASGGADGLVAAAWGCEDRTAAVA